MVVGLILTALLLLEIVINFAFFEDYRTPQNLLCLRLGLAASWVLLRGVNTWMSAVIALGYAATYPLEIRRTSLFVYFSGLFNAIEWRTPLLVVACLLLTLIFRNNSLPYIITIMVYMGLSA
jgi:hypothetical protein